MDYRDRLIADLARSHSERIVRRVAHQLRQHAGISEGETELKTVWDEICFQSREGESEFWWAYKVEIERCVMHYVSELEATVQQALWLQTEEGMKWECTLDPSDPDGDTTPIGTTEIVEYLAAAVIHFAGEVENRRVERFMTIHM